MSKREDVLARTFTILGTIQGINTTGRNRGLLEQDVRPCLLQLDGDEHSLTQASGGPTRRQVSPVIVTMTPQFFIILKTAKPQNVNIGQDLNSFRETLIKAISTDTQLLSIIGGNGYISYAGCETDLKSGSAVEGQMRLDFNIGCVMNPNSP